MKLSLAIVLAFVCAAFGGVHKRNINFDPAAFQASCPGQCFNKPEYREYIQGLKGKFEGLKNQAEASGAVTIPDIPEEKFVKLCTETTNIKTCVEACTDDADKKAKVLEVLTSAKDLVCDESIKANFNCLKQFSAIPSPACNTQCQSFVDTLKTHHQEHSQREPGSPPDFEKAKAAATAACGLVKCRLTCRKPEIVEKCQQAGLDTAKEFVQKLAALGQTVHKQFRPAENYPDACKPDKIVEGI